LKTPLPGWIANRSRPPQAKHAPTNSPLLLRSCAP
jgi:hypothetical protein